MKRIKLLYMLVLFVFMQVESICQETIYEAFDILSFESSLDLTAIQKHVTELRFIPGPLNPNRDLVKSRNGDKYYLDGTIENDDQMNYTYDDLDRLVSFFSQDEGVGSNTGVVTNGTGTITYNEDSDLISSSRVDYTVSDNSPDYYSTSTYTYNSENLVEEIYIEAFIEEGILDYFLQYTYAYSLEGKMESCDLVWYTPELDLTIKSNRVFSYDSLLRLDRIEIFTIPQDSTDFNLASTENIFYGENGKMSSSIVYGISNSEKMESRETGYSYDENDNLISIEIDYSNQAINDVRVEYEYNTEISQEELVYPVNYTKVPPFVDEYNSQLLFIRRMDSNGDVIPDRTVEFFWSAKGVETNVETTDLKLLNVYPNPVLSNLTFNDFEIEHELQLEIYDPQGRSLKSTKLINGEQSINVSNMSSGAFFYTLSQDGELLYSGRFIKE